MVYSHSRPHGRLSDISNIDVEQSGRHKQKDGIKHVHECRTKSQQIVITASGFHGAAKKQLQELVASIGATYSGDLVQGSTTHLVCKRLIDCFGSVKYQRALEWGIHIVSYGWLQTSSQAGRPVLEQEFMDDTPQAFNPSPIQCRQQQSTNQPPPHGTSENSTSLALEAAQQPRLVSDDISLTNSSDAAGTGASAEQQSMLATDIATVTAEQQACSSQKVSKQQEHQSPAKLSLADLPQDFLLQGGVLEDDVAVDAHNDELQGSIASSISLSQYSLQLHQEHQQQLCQDNQQQTGLLGCPEPGAAPLQSPPFRFATTTPVARAAVEQTSPCMQHFLPMQQRDCTASPSSHDIHSKHAETQSLAAASTDEQNFKIQQENQLPHSPADPIPCSQTLPDGVSLHDSTPCLASSMVSPDGATGVDADAGNGITLTDSPVRLLIPETQAELEDPWGSAAAAGDTPVSLKYYALQQRSRARTVVPAAATAGQAVLEASGAHIESEVHGGVDGRTDSVEWQEEAVDELEGSGSTSADETEEPSEDSSELTDGLSQNNESQDDCIRKDVAQLQEPAPRPWSGCSSTVQSQQQQQQPEFRLTQPSSSNDSSRRSSGLTRLKRRDGYRRMARVLVSELPDPSELELQDSDCELDCELQGLQGSVHDDAFGDDILDDSDCEGHCDQQEQHLAATKQQQQQQAGHVRQAQETQQVPVAQQSPVHSCSASSIPACESTAATAGYDRTHRQRQSEHGRQPTVCATATTPAVLSTTSMSSAGAMPVAKLNFLSSGSSQCKNQETGSVYTPSCSLQSSDYSSMSCMVSTGRVMASSTTPHYQVDNSHDNLTDDAAVSKTGTGQDQQQHEQQAPMTAAVRGSPLPKSSNFITRRKGAIEAPAIQDLAKLQQHRRPASAGHDAQQQIPALPVNTVFIKQEPEDFNSHTWQQQQQQQLQPCMSNPAECLLQAFTAKQQQKQQQQKQQQPKLRPAPLKVERAAAIKTEKISPAEKMLQDLRQRQQLQQEHKQRTGLAGAAADDIDDDADSQGTEYHHLQHQHKQQQQHKVPRSSLASYATDISSLSRKVPLKVSGAGEKVIEGNSSLPDGNAGSSTPLERLLQAALATKRTSGAAAAAAETLAAAAAESAIPAAAADVIVKQEAATWMYTPDAGAGVDQTTAAAAGCDSDDDAFEITGLPTNVVAARNKVMTKQLDAHLAHLNQTNPDQVIPLKLLSKAPRGSTAKVFHGLKSSSKVVYAEQIQVPWAHATLSTKEKSRCVIVAAAAAQGSGAADTHAGDSDSCGTRGTVILAEPVAFYKLESGDWWLELLRFYSTKELRLLAKAADCKLHLPADFHLSYELLRGMSHEHVPMRQVQGEFKLSKVRKVPSGSRSRVNPFFWRYSIDTATCQVLTDRPVSDYVM